MTTRKKIVIISIVMIVIGAGVGVYFMRDALFGGAPSKTSLPSSVDKNLNLKDITAVATAANTLSDSGAGPDKVQQVYDAAIESSTEPAVEAQYYIFKSSAYINEKQYDQAFEAASKAESLSPSKSTAAELAEVYVLKNDKPNAIKYFKLAIERAGDPTDNSNYVVEYYQQRITELEA